MASPGREFDPDLMRRHAFEGLAADPNRFNFFQAVRTLQLALAEAEEVGAFGPPSREAVRFGSHTTLEFPASDIQEFKQQSAESFWMQVNFMGLCAAQGVLPTPYAELLLERLREKDSALEAFFDLFNHRTISFFYRAWKKYRCYVDYEKSGVDEVSERLLDFIGLGTAGLRNRQEISDAVLLYYSGLLAQKPRTATALRQLLTDYFGVPVEVEQFAGTWFALPEEDQTQLNGGDHISERLGAGAIIGDEIWEQQSVVRIRMGPLSLEQYLDFLPEGGRAYEPLRAILEFYAGTEIDFELQLVLRRDETPGFRLGEEGPERPRLGWVTWVKNAQLSRDPQDTVLRITSSHSNQEQPPWASISSPSSAN